MNPLHLTFTRVDSRASPPVRAHHDDAGFDLTTIDAITLEPGERAVARTGLAVALPPGHAGLVIPRSGHALRDGLSIVNTPGLIDAGYRGEIKVILVNQGSVRLNYSAGERIAQLVVVEIPSIVAVEVDELEPSERADGGFGSSGR